MSEEKDILEEIVELEREGYRATAMRRLTRFLRENPNDPRGWYYMARFLGSPRQQKAAIDRALKLRPDFPEAREFRSILLEENPYLENRLFSRPVRFFALLALAAIAAGVGLALGLSVVFEAPQPEVVIVIPHTETPLPTVQPIIIATNAETVPTETPPAAPSPTATSPAIQTIPPSPTHAETTPDAPVGFVSATPLPTLTPPPEPTRVASADIADPNAQKVLIAPFAADTGNAAVGLSARLATVFNRGDMFFEVMDAPITNDVQAISALQGAEAAMIIYGSVDADVLHLQLYAVEDPLRYDQQPELFNLARASSPWRLTVEIPRANLGEAAAFASVEAAIGYLGNYPQAVIESIGEQFSKPRNVFDEDESLLAFILGYSYQALEQQAEALKIYDLLTTYSGEPNLNVVANRAYAIAQTGNYESAVTLYLSIVAQFPDPAFIQTNIGEIYLQVGDQNAAQLAFDEAIRLDPSSARPYVGRGRLLRSQNQYNRALEDFTQALSLDGAYALAYYERARLRRDLNLLDEALNDVDLAITFQPQIGEYYALRGAILLLQDNYEEAAAAFEQALQRGVERPEAYVGLAEAYFELGNLDGTIRQSNNALAMDQSLTRAWYLRGKAYLAQNELGSALEDFSQGLDRDPQDVDLLVARCTTHARLGDDGAAATDCDAALALDGQNGWALEQRGMIRARAGDRAGAAADFAEAVTYEPAAYEAHYYLGLYALQEGRYEAAIESLTTAIELAPFLGKAFSARGVTYRILGACELAIADLEESLELVPEDVYSYYELGLCKRALADQAYEAANTARAKQLYQEAAQDFLTFLNAKQPGDEFVAEAQAGLSYVNNALQVIEAQGS